MSTSIQVMPSHSSQPSHAVPANLTKAHTDFATFHEGYVRHYIALADTKATLVFGAASTLLAYLFSQQKFFNIIFKPSLTATCSLNLTTIALLALGAICAVLVITPRVTRSEEGVVFFVSVASYPSSSDYLNQIATLSESELTAARIQHSYNVSSVCTRKYDMLRRAIWFAGLGVASSLPVLGSL